MRVLFLSALAWLMLLQMGCKQQPVLTDIINTTAYPRQILGVSGTKLFATNVKWDAGLASESNANTSWLSARYFQVPDNATAGVHPVRLSNSEGASTTTINVTTQAASGSFPAPRVEEVGLYDIFSPGSASPTFWITVPAANGDIDAKVFVNNVEVPTIMYSAIPTDYLVAHNPSTFGNPIYHYTLYIAIIENGTYGANINVKIRNHDGTDSANRAYRLPDSYAERDSDGDGLLDEWEINGYPAPSGATINLATLGCDPRRKDLLIEVDWIAAAAPQAGIWNDIVTAFNNAPVLNPDGSQGINAIIDRGQGGGLTGGGTILANHSVMDWSTPPAGTTGFANFDTYKNNATNFNADRRNIFHYAIFGRGRPNGTSGRGEIWGNDFMVTFVNFSQWSQQLAQSGTFLHELGHNLSWRHGGIDNGATDANFLYKANFHSLMNYRYQFGGISTDCDVTPDAVLGFSEGIFQNINESTARETDGICDGGNIDYNCDGDTADTGPYDINTRPSQCPNGGDGTTNSIHRDYDQWGNIQMDPDNASSRWRNN